MGMTREFVCDASVEAELEDTVTVSLVRDGAPYTFAVPRGTPVEVACGKAIEATLDSVVGITGWAQWDCPRCGKTNRRELSADDLG